jgi:hypothetical protein
MNNDTIATILHASQWTATQRLVALDVFVSSSRRPCSQHLVLDTESSATAIASRLGVSARSVSDALHALSSVGVITWQKECHPDSAKNRFGESIPINRASRERGDFISWQHTSIIAMPVDVAIPASLPESANVARARQRSIIERQRVRQMQAELQALLRERDCPSCGAHGALQATISATCAECGTMLDADEIDAMLSTPAIPEYVDTTNVKTFHDSAFPHSENFSDEENALKEESPNLAVPELAALDALGAPGAEHENFSRAELDVFVSSDGAVPELAALDALGAPGAEHENFSRAELDVFVSSDDELDMPAELTGSDAITYLASVGVELFGRLHVIGGKKAGYMRDFLDIAVDLAQAIAHIERSAHHLVGVLPEHCSFDVLDIDAGLSEFMKTFPRAASWCRVIRSNAPERAKFIIRVKGDKLKHASRELSDKARKIEVMGTRHSGVVAGMHPSGVPYVLIPGVIPELDATQVQAMLDAFIPPMVPAVPMVRSAPMNRSSSTSGSAAKRAISHWLAQPANIAATRALIERRPHSGKHFSLRDNDSTPSAMLVSADAVHDYGNDEHYDLFDVWCMLTGTNKRAAIHDAYLQMRACSAAPG